MAEANRTLRQERLLIKVIMPKQYTERKVPGGGTPPKPFRPVDQKYRASLSSQVAAIRTAIVPQIKTAGAAPVRVNQREDGQFPANVTKWGMSLLAICWQGVWTSKVFRGRWPTPSASAHSEAARKASRLAKSGSRWPAMLKHYSFVLIAGLLRSTKVSCHYHGDCQSRPYIICPSPVARREHFLVILGRSPWTEPVGKRRFHLPFLLREDACGTTWI